MIYCVIPQDVAAEMLPAMEAHYADDPGVKVIVDRREHERRATDAAAGGPVVRLVRDRRRPRVVGDFPPVDPSAA